MFAHGPTKLASRTWRVQHILRWNSISRLQLFPLEARLAALSGSIRTPAHGASPPILRARYPGKRTDNNAVPNHALANGSTSTSVDQKRALHTQCLVTDACMPRSFDQSSESGTPISTMHQRLSYLRTAMQRWPHYLWLPGQSRIHLFTIWAPEERRLVLWDAR